ncbi:uncharacterized protein BDZ99DRAFT_272115 [Mytilinidion resinicola]|uniref:Uncharacterized protein n=1 Tax=Mytilinidion resinicola TaxID=574789 RepID=A0A6A6YWC6_9PEZI|nr:uncharacterized protein BDZ99DRAFT_272115 [Mytilinidion resinicola]KAF2812693.1 hypothetical protein BDZ99DRAFT_272115 [Mytilinidion resinicola]
MRRHTESDDVVLLANLLEFERDIALRHRKPDKQPVRGGATNLLLHCSEQSRCLRHDGAGDGVVAVRRPSTGQRQQRTASPEQRNNHQNGYENHPTAYSVTKVIGGQLEDLKQRGARSLCLGDSILMAVKWRTLNSVVLAAIDNACRRPSAREEAQSS